jgi:hypothetical protein
MNESKTYMSIVLALLMLPQAARQAFGQQPFVVDKFLTETVRLANAQIESIHRGKPFAIVLDSPTPDEVFVFGIIYIESRAQRYLEFANDFDALRKLPNYLAIQKFSEPPQLSDLGGFTIDADDLKELKVCKPGDCELQLPSEAMEQFRKSINWTASDTANQVNLLARQMALDALQAYQKGGNAALGVYRDKDHPTRIGDTFQALLSRLTALPVYLPDLNRILLEYPGFQPPDSQSDFYWEKVNFGLKPTLRMVHQIIYRDDSSADATFAVALKQLYASHYFQSALDLTVCVRDVSHPANRGFYLITVKASRQAGLTGLKGGILRKVVVGKTRSSLEHTLTAIKQKLESAPQ